MADRRLSLSGESQKDDVFFCRKDCVGRGIDATRQTQGWLLITLEPSLDLSYRKGGN